MMKSKVFFIFLLSLLFLPFNIQANVYSVVWTPERIEQTLGFEETIDIRATFTSSIELNNVDLWVVPKLEPFVRLEPKHFESIEAHTPYEVTVHISVPHGTYPGLYDGTIHLKVGNKTYPQTLNVDLSIFYENVSIPSTTKVLGESTTQHLLTVSTDGSTLTFSETTPELKSLLPGDVIVIGITPVTPNGLLRKVITVSIANNQVVVETTQAALDDAIEDGTIELNKHLTPNDIRAVTALSQGVSFTNILSTQALEGFYIELNDIVLYDEDDNYGTRNDQIKANGGISINPGFVFNLDIDDFQLKQLNFITTADLNSELEIEAKVAILDIQKKVEIARYNLTPFTIWVGWLPVIITPNLTVNVGLDGEISVGIETSVTQEANLTAGLTFDDGIWSPISTFSNSFQFNPPMPSAGCNFKGYTGPQLNLLIYGVIGPHSEICGYLEVDADLFRIPWWELYGGLEVGVGVRFEVLDHLIADYYDPDVIGYRLLLAQGEEEGTYVVASGAEYYGRPRINSNCEIVWSQSSKSTNGTYQIWSNLRGQISFGNLDKDPDINDNGEIIWRFGDGGQGPDGIMSNDRGLIYSEQGGSINPYYNTHRINNNGEIVWSRPLWPIGYRAEEIWSNIRGRLTYSPEYTINRQTAINDEGEVVYRCYMGATGNIIDILSTEQGFITDDSLWQSYPDINNSGEVVWEEGGEIWSNTKGRITTNGLHPSINNSGEIVWEYFDGNDYEIYSNIRGQITDNDVNDNMPHINDSGAITWLSNNTVMATFQ